MTRFTTNTKGEARELPNFPAFAYGFTVLRYKNLVVVTDGRVKISIPVLPFTASIFDVLNMIDGKTGLHQILPMQNNQDKVSYSFLIDTLTHLTSLGIIIDGRKSSPSRLSPSFDFIPDKVLNVTDVGVLSEASIAIVGLGEIGNLLAKILWLANVKDLIVVDNVKVSEDIIDDVDIYQHKHLNLSRPMATQNVLQRYSSESNFMPLVGGVELLTPYHSNIDVIVMATDEFRQCEYKAVNDFCLEFEIPWTSYRITPFFGGRVEIGPSLIPPRSGCFQCYLQRIFSNASNGDVDRALLSYLDAGGKFPRLSDGPKPLSHLLVGEIMWLINRSSPDSWSRMWTYDISSARVDDHVVLRVPGCSTCGSEII